MMEIDLESMSIKDLKQLQRDVTVAIAEYGNREKRKKLEEVEAFMKERGLGRKDLAELLGKASKSGKVSVGAPKYANPADPSQTWTGRGRKPGWARAHLAAGGSLSALAI